MSAYFIISYDIVDFDMFQNYPPRVWDLLQEHGGELLVSDTDAMQIEGERNMMHAVIRFPSQEQALACFNSDAYQNEIKQFRHGSTTNSQVVLARGFDPLTA
ncbi:DUF1330 domain-containing protein [Paracoccus sp. PAR01]|uniref:DUF1330 domain-containing protein n=1 Tax=Paracoccus sp. PAR01 TaxID=2769282 RepID=UPI00178488F6|nr:DUF1330 domain-containing protein [Paracoccus sp. PAR01]MBD9527140.1 DUF1330 domain-containing protein [Paracoccus sp. PAR01]